VNNQNNTHVNTRHRSSHIPRHQLSTTINTTALVYLIVQNGSIFNSIEYDRSMLNRERYKTKTTHNTT